MKIKNGGNRYVDSVYRDFWVVTWEFGLLAIDRTIPLFFTNESTVIRLTPKIRAMALGPAEDYAFDAFPGEGSFVRCNRNSFAPAPLSLIMDNEPN